MVAATKTRMQIRIDPKLKEEGERLFRSMGTDLSSAVSMFVAQAVHEGGFPFRPVADPLAAAVKAAESEPAEYVGSTQDVKDMIDAL
ncbi:type II toxin-antitoxin system RelB/DinJ family antitoxin [Bifidobacterium sp. ESL0775]|uniref:type II toxin-antitoxin system RelB/DinJ family antitoxin n=1 Tax=Bifidobacterium sp. ESL0775 TaxID=2983230 RepID=UPI0023F92EF4|nr:type II toxin-antitoxin system RelB/DinJ family antitoxin [Bifidobacterium sp. ESL0775]WEV69535.1 type II toxin-antitoxin system RelB/DinJ family antitoxin [Bifidobacterium sp. ESL0775]